MSSSSATQNTYPYQNEPTWSKSEKAIARTAFDAASEAGTSGRWRRAQPLSSASPMATIGRLTMANPGRIDSRPSQASWTLPSRARRCVAT
jgi:hypothetical protein